MSAQRNQFYEFGAFRIDVQEHTLLRDGQIVPLKPKVFDMLLVLVENSGRLLEKDELMNRVWPDTIVEENNLTVNMSALRKALGEGYSEAQYIETVPRRGYRFVASVKPVRDHRLETASEPAATSTSRQDQQAESPHLIMEKHTRAIVQIEEDEGEAVAQEKPAEPQKAWLAAAAARIWTLNRKTTITLIITLVAIAVAGVYLWLASRTPPNKTIASVKSVAVLPFKSMNAQDGDEYLGLGMADALITKLSNVRQITVRPTSAITRYAAAEQNPIEVGRELHVDSVLDGRIQKTGDKIRLTVQLVNVTDGSPLWAGKFDENFTSIFAVQDSISEQVTHALTLMLTDEEKHQLSKRYTDNTEAYKLYLKGNYFSKDWTDKGFHQALDDFHQAIAIDPTYALAYAGLADTYYRHATVHIPLQDAVPKARAAAMEALRLDNDLAEAHTSLGMIKFRYDWDWAGAEDEFRRAIDLNPNYATAHQWYSEYWTARGRADEAIAEANRAEQIDPLSPEVAWDLGLALFFARRYDQAESQFGKTIELNPQFWLSHAFLGWCYGEQGKFDKAFAEYDQARALDDNADTLSHLASIYVKAGKRNEAQNILGELLQRARRKYVSPFYIAAVYASLDLKEQAFAWLEKAIEERNELLVFLKVAPNFDAIRADARFQVLLRRIGCAP